MSADLWQRGCERLAAELPEQQFNTWIRPLPAAEITEQGDAGAVATVRVPNRFKLDWIRNQYAGRIEADLPAWQFFDGVPGAGANQFLKGELTWQIE